MRFILGFTLTITILLNACRTIEPVTDTSCIILAILPPENIDEVTSDYVATQWISEIKRRKILKSCDKILHPNSIRDLYSALNISNKILLAASGLANSQSNYLKKNANATHVASLKYRYSNGTISFEASLQSLTERASPSKHPLTQSLVVRGVEPSYFDLDSSRRFGLYLTQLVPTALSIGTSKTEFPNKYAEKGPEQRLYEINKVKKSQLPPILSSIRLENIPFRNGYNIFDWSLRFMPYFNITAINNSYTYATVEEYNLKQGDRNTMETLQYSLLFYGITPNLLGEFAIYLPIGALFYGMGGGPSLSYQSDSAGNTKYAMRLSMMARLGYRAFIQERWYFQINSETQDYKGQVKNKYFQSSPDFYFILGVGYLFPELQRKIRENIF